MLVGTARALIRLLGYNAVRSPLLMTASSTYKTSTVGKLELAREVKALPSSPHARATLRRHGRSAVDAPMYMPTPRRGRRAARSEAIPALSCSCRASVRALRHQHAAAPPPAASCRQFWPPHPPRQEEAACGRPRSHVHVRERRDSGRYWGSARARWAIQRGGRAWV